MRWKCIFKEPATGEKLEIRESQRKRGEMPFSLRLFFVSADFPGNCARRFIRTKHFSVRRASFVVLIRFFETPRQFRETETVVNSTRLKKGFSNFLPFLNSYFPVLSPNQGTEDRCSQSGSDLIFLSLRRKRAAFLFRPFHFP